LSVASELKTTLTRRFFLSLSFFLFPYLSAGQIDVGLVLACIKYVMELTTQDSEACRRSHINDYVMMTGSVNLNPKYIVDRIHKVSNALR